MKPITIAGGGLAGLALGIALRNRGIPTTLYEAGHYPRHRVCGEFISGIDQSQLELLGIADLLEDCPRPRSVRWHRRDQPLRRDTLPQAAYAISRHRLDEALAQRFVELGGALHENHRYRENPQPGVVWATGRQPQRSSSWIGLKMHFADLPLHADLEMHLGTQGYCGLVAVEPNRVNLCGLFRLQPSIRQPREQMLLHYLEANGLHTLLERAHQATPHPESASAVAGFQLGWQNTAAPDEVLQLGDSQAMIPPFTGNGMTMAWESAAIALPTLCAYAQEQLEWEECCQSTHRKLRRLFSQRLRTARLLHPFLLHPAGQCALSALQKCHLLPFTFFWSRLR